MASDGSPTTELRAGSGQLVSSVSPARMAELAGVRTVQLRRPEEECRRPAGLRLGRAKPVTRTSSTFRFFRFTLGCVTATLESRTVLPPKEQRDFAELLDALGSSSVSICDGAGRAIALPEEVRDAFHNVALAMAQGNGIQLVPRHMTLTTQQAADILNVSRPTLVKLLQEQRIPYERPGRHRRIRLDALLKYQEETQVQRRKALREATRDSTDEVRALLGKKD
jgi:excisionase family DNA binding protein